MRARAILLGTAVALSATVLRPEAPLEGPAPAEAAVSIQASLDELVKAATYVVVAEAQERRSVWEDLPSGRRIVTYTRMKIESAVLGAPGAEIWVRTLGGAVGKIGQSVSGEAQLPTGSRSMLFVTAVDGVNVVTGLAQGHYPIAPDLDGVARLKSSPDVGTLLPRKAPSLPARDVLLGAKVEDAIQAIVRARQAQDAKP